jgi:3-methyladenine DNA glycosylase AlkC
MQEQVRLMAETTVDMAAAQDKPALITALAASPVEKVRGVAAFVVPMVYPDDLQQQLDGLYFTGSLEGTWPRELSATILHRLIIQHGVTTILPLVQDWTKEPEPATRRLVVESFRPRGVMLAHITELKQDPMPLKTILKPLLDDPADYVRKAVANNLNDISRDNPDVVLSWAEEWLTPAASKERQWIISRALRTLVNEGDPTALKLLGYTSASTLNVVWADNTPSEVKLNQLLPFEFEISNPTETIAQVILLLFMDEPGKGQNRRQSNYQIWKGKLKAGEAKSISKKIHFVDKSTQPKEPGTYCLTVTLNGEKLAERDITFER